mgnify:CR=1 FL=1
MKDRTPKNTVTHPQSQCTVQHVTIRTLELKKERERALKAVKNER